MVTYSHEAQKRSPRRDSAYVALRPGAAKGPRLYAVHGLDGDVLGYSYGTLAQQLAGWRVAALQLDEEAIACDSVAALAACYNRRVSR